MSEGDALKGFLNITRVKGKIHIKNDNGDVIGQAEKGFTQWVGWFQKVVGSDCHQQMAWLLERMNNTEPVKGIDDE